MEITRRYFFNGVRYLDRLEVTGSLKDAKAKLAKQVKDKLTKAIDKKRTKKEKSNGRTKGAV